MKTLLENEFPSLDSLDLDSLDLDDATDFARRIDALEDTVNTFTARLENDVLARIRSLEDALTGLTVTSRNDLARESAARHDQLACLAGKVSKKIDAMQRTAINIEEKQVIVTKQVQTRLEDRIAETRDEIAVETSELRAVLQAKLDELTGGRDAWSSPPRPIPGGLPTPPLTLRRLHDYGFSSLMPSYSRSPERASRLTSASLLLFRLGCAGILLYFHGWDSATAAWNRVWNEQPWPLIDHLETIHYPFPLVLSIVAAVICVAAPVSIILGFLVRLSALFILAVVLLVMPVSLGRGAPLEQELSLLYVLAFLLLFLQGGGSYGLDAVFRKKKGA